MIILKTLRLGQVKGLPEISRLLILAQVQVYAQRLPLEGHLGTETGILRERGEGRCITHQAGTQPTSLQPSTALTLVRTP